MLSGFAADATVETILHSASRLDDDGKIRDEDDGGKNLNKGKIDDDLAKLVDYENPSPIQNPDGSGGVIKQEPRPVKENAIPSGITLDNNLEEKVSQTPWQMRRVMEDIIRDAVLGDSPKATEDDDWHKGGFGGGTYAIEDPNKRSIDGILEGGDTINGTENQPSPAANMPPAVTVTPNTPPLTNNDDASKILTLSSSMLTAKDDATTKPEELTYTLVSDITGGEVGKTESSTYTKLATGGTFTQKEIDQEKITFVWNGTEPQPKFDFTVSDNAATPGVSQPQEFKVAVTTVGGTQSPNTTVTPLNAAIDERPNTRSMDGVGKNFNGYKDIKTPFPNPFNKDEYSKIEIQNNQGAVIATYENKEGGSTTLLVGDGKDGFYFDPGTEDFNPTEYKVVLTKASDSTTTEIPLAGNTITKAERNIVLNTPTEAAAIKTGENLVLSAKFPTGEEGDFYDATQLEKSGLSLNLAITVGGEVRTITVPLQGLTVAPETQDPTKLNIQIPPDNLNMIQGQITKIDFSASTEPSDAAKIATIDTDIDFSGNTSIQAPTNNNQNQTPVKPDNTATNTTQNTSTNTATTNSSSTPSTMNPPPIKVGNRTITGSESAVILQAALRNNKDPKTNQPYYSGLITGNWDEPSANALKKYIADNTGKPIEKTLPKGTENVSGKLIGSWSSGDDVKTVQQTLNTKANDLKIAKLAEDGQFGPQTEAAIKAFQEYYNTKNTVKPIKIDGILGPETELAMNTQFNMTLFKTT